MLLLALLVTTLGACAVALRTRASLGSIPTVVPGPIPEQVPLVSVIVPARNEAANIGRCLEGLLAQDYPNFEVILVDDQSTDGTGEIAAALQQRDPRLRVVPGRTLPSGWTGKCFAVSQGAALARGEWLLFTDADTVHHPQTLSALVRESTRQGADLLSLMTLQVLGSFWERVVQPVVLGALVLAAPFRAANDPARRDFAIANGQVMFVRRTVYDALGGHASVRSEIVEDFALARKVKQAGYRLLFLNGMPLVRARMYQGLSDLWTGWTKNAYLGPGGGLPLAVGGLVLITTLGLGPFLAWGAAVASTMLSPNAKSARVLGLATLHVGAVLYGWAKVCKSVFQLPRRYAFGLPLGALILDAILINSAYRHLSGRGVTWKGREYREHQGASLGVVDGDASTE